MNKPSNKFFTSEFHSFFFFLSASLCVVAYALLFVLSVSFHVHWLNCTRYAMHMHQISNFFLNWTAVHHYYHAELDRIACQRKLKFHKFFSPCGGRLVFVHYTYTSMHYIYMMRFTIIKHFSLYSKDIHFLNWIIHHSSYSILHSVV